MHTISTRSIVRLIDRDKLAFFISTEADDFTKLNCKENDGSDPLGVDDFIKNKAKLYRKNNLSTVYAVRYEDKIIAFFTISMSAISLEKLSEEDTVSGYTPKSYPAMLLGNMGVDSEFQKKGVGKSICNFVVGLAQDITQRVACAVVRLQTDKSRFGYYEEKCGFKYSKKQNLESKVWMYRKILDPPAFTNLVTENWSS